MADSVGRQEPRLQGARPTDDLHLILDATADGVVVVDRDGVIWFANPAAEELFGQRADQLVGQEFGFPLVDGTTTELDVVRGPSVSCVVEMRVVSINWAGVPAFVASLRDITERKRAEEERLKLREEQAARKQAEQALRARDEFLALAAHELKTPLTSLKGFAQLMARRSTFDLDLLNRMLGQINRLDRITRDLLEIARLENGRLELQPHNVDLIALVEAAVLEIQATTSKHTLRFEAPDGPVTGQWDGDRVVQILENLLSNAVKYSPDAGDVVVRVRSLENEVEVSVQDCGLGIAPQLLPRVFERFYRVADSAETASGLGLGLYVTRTLVEAHGGRIRAESDGPGLGCRFVFTLPLDRNTDC